MIGEPAPTMLSARVELDERGGVSVLSVESSAPAVEAEAPPAVLPG